MSDATNKVDLFIINMKLDDLTARIDEREKVALKTLELLHQTVTAISDLAHSHRDQAKEIDNLTRVVKALESQVEVFVNQPDTGL
jgi:hypothetical protein